MKKKKFRVIVDRDRCKGCRLCVEFCPCSVLEMSRNDINAKGVPFAEAVAEEKCTGCLSCALVCPECAIEIMARTKDEGES